MSLTLKSEVKYADLILPSYLSYCLDHCGENPAFCFLKTVICFVTDWSIDLQRLVNLMTRKATYFSPIQRNPWSHSSLVCKLVSPMLSPLTLDLQGFQIYQV